MVAIDITLSILIIVAWLLAWRSVKICVSFSVNVIEALVFLNLIVLSTAKLNDIDSFELTFSLVGMVFAIVMCIIFYQFYFFYISKSRLWLKFISIPLTLRQRFKKQEEVSENDDEIAPLIIHPPRAVIGLRESLLEENPNAQ